MKKNHNDQKLSSLSRRDLLELMIQQNRKIEQLQASLEEANRKLQQRELVMEQSGSIAEAALKLNEVFESVQNACDQYQLSVQRQNEQTIEQTRQQCDRMLEEARRQAQQIQQAEEASNE